MFLLVNKYHNPNSNKVSTQCHELDDNLNIIKSFQRMDGDSLELFSHYPVKMVCNVVKASLLDDITILRN